MLIILFQRKPMDCENVMKNSKGIILVLYRVSEPLHLRKPAGINTYHMLSI